MSRLPKLLSVKSPRPGVLDVVWADGAHRRIDVSARLERHLLMQELKDPALFAKVQIDEFGAGVTWPNGVDFCADAMRIWGDEQLTEYERESA